MMHFIIVPEMKYLSLRFFHIVHEVWFGNTITVLLYT